MASTGSKLSGQLLHPRKNFVLRKPTRSRRGIFLHFPRLVTYSVVKLATDKLPRKGRVGKPIHWLVNWKIKDIKGKVVRKTQYSLFLPKPSNREARFVYYVNGSLRWNKTPKSAGRKRGLRSLVKVSFETGDPAAGWG